jgi:hypothetical protein
MPGNLYCTILYYKSSDLFILIKFLINYPSRDEFRIIAAQFAILRDYVLTLPLEFAFRDQIYDAIHLDRKISGRYIFSDQLRLTIETRGSIIAQYV